MDSDLSNQVSISIAPPPENGEINIIDAIRKFNLGTLCAWTPVATPPPKPGRYLVTRCYEEDWSTATVQKAFWSGQSWEIEYVVAWAPLPEPYRPQE